MRTPLRLALLIGLVSLSCASASAQVTTGTPAFGRYATSSVDTIDLGNLNIHIVIPVLQKAGRGVPFDYDITYDSSIWQRVGSAWQITSPPNASFGWFFPIQGTVEPNGQGESYCYTNYGPPAGLLPTGGEESSNVTYYDPLGTPHPLQGTITAVWGTCGSGGTTYSFSGGGPATDGSGYVLSMDSSGDI